MKMNSIQRLFCLNLVFAVLFSLAGCGEEAVDPNNLPTPKMKDPSSVDIKLEMSRVKGRDPKTRGFAIFKLGQAGPRAEEALPLLEEIANNPDDPHTKAAQDAVAKIKPAPAE